MEALRDWNNPITRTVDCDDPARTAALLPYWSAIYDLVVPHKRDVLVQRGWADAEALLNEMPYTDHPPVLNAHWRKFVVAIWKTMGRFWEAEALGVEAARRQRLSRALGR